MGNNKYRLISRIILDEPEEFLACFRIKIIAWLIKHKILCRFLKGDEKPELLKFAPR